MKDYQKLALRTESTMDPVLARVTGDSKYIRLIHAALGIAGEVSEFANAVDQDNALEELGDCQWYVAIASSALGKGMPPGCSLPITADAYTKAQIDDMLGSTAGHIVDVVKGFVFYGKTEFKVGRAVVPVEARLYQLLEYFTILTHIAAVVLYNRSLDELRYRNIAKLQKRYPNKFEESLAAGERDYAAEAAAAEHAVKALGVLGPQTIVELSEFSINPHDHRPAAPPAAS